jgi:hypothetical protein
MYQCLNNGQMLVELDYFNKLFVPCGNIRGGHYMETSLDTPPRVNGSYQKLLGCFAPKRIPRSLAFA